MKPVSTHSLALAAWQPVSQARVWVTEVLRPAAPVVDAHNHLGRWLSPTGDWLVVAYWAGSEVPPKGRWLISAADLPVDVLPRLYAENARDILRLGIA